MLRLPTLRAIAAAMIVSGPTLLPAPASAHAQLLTEVPAAGAAVATPAPTELRLSFSEAIELSFTKVAITGPDGAAIATGTLSLDPADAKTLIVPLMAPLPAGTITVTWTAVAADGHKSKGSYTLTVAG